jgi:hypothetical protein
VTGLVLWIVEGIVAAQLVLLAGAIVYATRLRLRMRRLTGSRGRGGFVDLGMSTSIPMQAPMQRRD